VEVLTDDICDALVVMIWENHHPLEHRSQPWIDRQMRKVDGGMRTLAGYASERSFVVDDCLGLADVATACRYLDVRSLDYPWRQTHPKLSEYSDRIEKRPSFVGSVPVPKMISDKVV